MARSLFELDTDARFTLGLTLVVAAGTLGLAFMPFLFRAWRTARRPLPTPMPAGIRLVFGKRLENGGPDADYRLRLVRAERLMTDNPRVPTILLGGRYVDHEPSEAEAGRRYLEARLDPESTAAPIILEDGSLDTLMNLRNARELLADLVPNAPVVFISSRYHLARCARIGDSLRIAHTLCPAESTWTWDRRNTLRLLAESVFLLWFETGRTWARLTSNRRMLARIS